MISATLARFRENLLAAGVSHATAATLCGLKPSTLSSAFREIMQLESTKEAELLTISFRLLELREALKPLGMPESVGDLEQLLNRMKDGSITPEKVRETVSLIFEQ
jgi:hypothetical protein